MMLECAEKRKTFIGQVFTTFSINLPKLLG